MRTVARGKHRFPAWEVVRNNSPSKILRLLALEKMCDPGSIANIDCLLDTVTALVADCDHDNVMIIKNIETYIKRCKSVWSL